MVTHRWPPLDLLFEGLSLIGSFGLLWLAIAVVLSHGPFARPWLWVRVGAAILLAESLSYGLKVAVGRDRPSAVYAEPETLLEAPTTPSFPSGHATVAFASAVTLAFAVPRLRWPLLGLAALVAFSRVWVGVHFPLDVVGGAVLGAAIAIALRWLRAGLRRSAPPPTPG